ncbi:hypothetical protein RF55_10653 [Lasius niger]|uniref:Uncharacterized protein n=1 Tax=Lasius niger TaxID=67767 RepID=A0A0J7KHK3_LASNI|nr:hypothetical protein RF55_10653 [Lasius niger]
MKLLKKIFPISAVLLTSSSLFALGGCQKLDIPFKGRTQAADGATITFCANSGLGCHRIANKAEWQQLYNASGRYHVGTWDAPWGKKYLIPYGYNHREDWVAAWKAAEKDCETKDKCEFPAFVQQARKSNHDMLHMLDEYNFPKAFRPFFQPTMKKMQSKGDTQYQCDLFSYICTPFIDSPEKQIGFYRPHQPLTYITSPTELTSAAPLSGEGSEEAHVSKADPNKDAPTAQEKKDTAAPIPTASEVSAAH